MPEHYHKFDDESLFVATKLYRWGSKRKRLYIHLYYNAYRAASTYDDFMSKLLDCKHELENGTRVKANELFYNRYFIVRETPVRGLSVKYNSEAIADFRNRYAGFFILITNTFKEPIITLETYRNKDVVENCFDDLKNQLDMKRLRVHSSASMDTRLFLQFPALIYISALRKRMRNSKMLSGLSVRELLESMESYVKIQYVGKYGCLFTELTKTQRLTVEELKVDIPKS